jgi:hypothetical protein
VYATVNASNTVTTMNYTVTATMGSTNTCSWTIYTAQ